MGRVRDRCYHSSLIAVLVYIDVSRWFVLVDVYVLCGQVSVKYQRRDKRVATFGNGSSQVTLNLTRTLTYTLRSRYRCMHAYIYASTWAQAGYSYGRG